MLNLLRYKQKAEYPAGFAHDGKEITGREAYHTRYIPAFQETTKHIQGIKVVWISSTFPCGYFAGPAHEKWDDVAIVEYPNIETFIQMATGEDYKTKADPHRLAGVEDCRLLPMLKVMSA